jgi:cell division protein FtsI/penicillin-binding protein 2
MDWRPIRSTPPRPGGDVYLTIEEPIQHTVEQELDLIMETFKPLAAYAVMADPRTGRILAMAQRPTFDPNDRSPGNMAPEKWINRVVSTGFEPGSVMKGISVAGAIDYGVVTLDHVFDCEKGYWVYARRPLRDSHRFEDLSVLEILQHSSNIGTAKIALEMGERRLYQTLWRFGFGQRTGTGFDDEGTGLLRPVNRWDGLSVTRFPIGQGILTTPLQLVQAFSALANNGNMMQLRVVDRVADPTTGETKLFPPVLRRRVVAHESAIRDVVTALKMVTTDDGTASKAAIEGYEVAGKTGTAQKYIREELPDHKGYTGYYSNSKYVGSFIGFVPADDPAFVLLVSVDEPTEGGYYGGTVAAPSFRRIAASTLRYLQIPPGNSGETIRDVVSTNSSSETVSVLR